MVNKQSDIAHESISSVTSNTTEPLSTEKSSPKASKQEVMQSGKFNTAISEGASVHIGDRYYSSAAENIQTVIEALKANGILPTVEHTSKSTGDIHLASLSFDVQLADRLNTQLRTLEELHKAKQLSKEQYTEFNKLKDKISSMMEMQKELKVIEAEAKTLLEAAIENLTKKLCELQQDQAYQFDLGIKEAHYQECLHEQINLLQQFQDDLKKSEILSYWLDKERTNGLEKKLVEHSLNENPAIRHNLSAKKVKALYFTVEQILERLSHCLTWGRKNILDDSVSRLRIDDEIYISAFKYLGTIVPDRFHPDAVNQLQGYIDYLIKRLPEYEKFDVD